VKTLRYRYDIDGLRAIAVSIVVLFHAGLPFLSGGFVGVDVFFVISGYLITNIIRTELEQGRFSITTFYARRAKRILPALFFALATTLLVGWVLLTPSEYRELGKEGVAALLSLGNIYYFLSGGYFDGPAEFKLLLMTWSLGVEEQFYVFFPLLLLFLNSIGKKTLIQPVLWFVVLGSFTAASLHLALQPHSPAVFYLPQYRTWELGIGVLLSYFFPRIENISKYSPRWIVEGVGTTGLALIVLPAVLYSNTTNFPGIAALLPCLGAALLIVTSGSHINRKILSLPPVVYLGKISYSLYLWHWVLFSFGRTLVNGGLTPLQTTLILCLSVGLAIISFHFIEQPFRAHRMASVATLTRYGSALGVLVIIFSSLYATSGYANRFPGLETVVDHNPLTDKCTVSSDMAHSLNRNCISQAGNVTIILVGDSHANALAPEMRNWAAAHGYTFIEITQSGCRPITGMTIVDGSGRPLCHAGGYADAVEKFVKQTTGTKVVVLAGRLSHLTSGTGFGQTEHNAFSRYVVKTASAQTPDILAVDKSRENIRVGLNQFVDNLVRLHTKVLLLDQPPELGFLPASCGAVNRIWGRASLSKTNCQMPEPSVVDWRLHDGKEILTSIASRHRADVCYYSLSEQLFDGEKYFYRIRSTSLYSDDDHLNNAGSRYVLKNLNLSRCFPTIDSNQRWHAQTSIN